MRIRNKTKHYLKYEGTINKLAKRWVNKTDLQFNDLKSIGNGAYLQAMRTYDADKSKFSTWLWNVVDMNMLSYAKKQQQYKKLCAAYQKEQKNKPKYYEQNHFSDWLISLISKISEEAKEVIEIILKSPQEFIELMNDQSEAVPYRVLCEQLKEHGISWNNSFEARKEIKAAMAQI